MTVGNCPQGDLNRIADELELIMALDGLAYMTVLYDLIAKYKLHPDDWSYVYQRTSFLSTVINTPQIDLEHLILRS